MTIAQRIRKARRVYLIGNGGSYANAMHIANDLLSCGVRAYTMDPSTLTAFANDHGYESAYKLWLLTVGEKGDMLLALSGSGRSPNIVAAVNTAKAIGMDVELVTDYLRSRDMQESEEDQVRMGHDVMRELKATTREAA